MAIHRAAGRTLLLILAGSGLIAACAGMLAGSIPALPGPGAVLYLVLGVAGLLIFVPGVARLGWQLVQRRPIVEIGPDGILDRRLSSRPIPWTAVRGVRHTAVQRQRFVTLDLAPGAAGTLITGRVNRVMHRLNQRSGFPGVHLSTVGLSCTASELAAAIERYRR